MNIELKPCPFCGGEAVFSVNNDAITPDCGTVRFYFTIKCRKCGVSPDKTFGCARVSMGQNGEFNINRDEMDKAAKEWNGRIGCEVTK